MKKSTYTIFEFICHGLIYFSCVFKSPRICSFFIRLSILKQKFFLNNFQNKKIIIILDRSIGHREVEIIQNFANKSFKFFFLRRSITKLILYYFCNKKNLFFNYLKPKISRNDYFNQNKIQKKNHEEFWSLVIHYMKNYFKTNTINFVTFNFSYYAEESLYVGCKKNNIPVKLWYKEGIKTKLEAEYDVKNSKFKHMFKYFYKISVYNNLVKKMLISMDNLNKKKILVNGCPRVYDYIKKKKEYKKVKNLLFLSFDSKRGIPKYNKNKKLNWNLSYDKVIDILNELVDCKDLNIVIKRKSLSTFKTSKQISNRIKIFERGTAKKFINQADIIIGQNSASTVEALINGKIVLIPFFEKKKIFQKYLYRFNKELIYTSEKKMKQKILSLVNKQIHFPLSDKKHKKTIVYYLGDIKNIKNRYINFLSS